MPRFTESIPLILSALAERADPGRPPVEQDDSSLFAAVASAFLARLGDARVVNAATEVLRQDGQLDPRTFADADPVAVEDSWRSGGAKSLVKAVRPLQRLARWLSSVSASTGSLSTEALRDGLRSIHGIGPATADALLLEALGRPAYPVDRATYRILVRHGWLDPGAEYDDARAVVEGALDGDAPALARLSRGFGRIGREACKPSVAKCDRCPLRPFLPEGGPIEE